MKQVRSLYLLVSRTDLHTKKSPRTFVVCEIRKCRERSHEPIVTNPNHDRGDQRGTRTVLNRRNGLTEDKPWQRPSPYASSPPSGARAGRTAASARRAVRTARSSPSCCSRAYVPRRSSHSPHQSHRPPSQFPPRARRRV